MKVVGLAHGNTWAYLDSDTVWFLLEILALYCFQPLP